MKINKAYLYALLSVLSWSTVATAFKISLDYLSFIQLVFYSSLFSFLILGILLLSRKTIKRQEFSLIKNYKSVYLGFINPFLYYFVLLKAYSLLPAQLAQPLNYTWPLALVFMSAFFLKRHLTFKSIIALVISFIGVILVSSEGNLPGFQINKPLGVGLAIGSSVIWAMYWILNMKDTRKPVIKLFFNFGYGVIFSFIALLLAGEWSIPPFNGILCSAYIGLFELAIPFIFWLKALNMTTKTDKISNLVYISPFLSLVFIAFILHENIYYTTIVGLVFIIFGIFVQYLHKDHFRKNFMKTVFLFKRNTK
jgi:drug/metabolite transporter (DMT)-like permease